MLSRNTVVIRCRSRILLVLLLEQPLHSIARVLRIRAHLILHLIALGFLLRCLIFVNDNFVGKVAGMLGVNRFVNGEGRGVGILDQIGLLRLQIRLVDGIDQREVFELLGHVHVVFRSVAQDVHFFGQVPEVCQELL